MNDMPPPVQYSTAIHPQTAKDHPSTLEPTMSAETNAYLPLLPTATRCLFHHPHLTRPFPQDLRCKPASKLLTSSTRNVNVHGLALQQAHENAGWCLATEYISQALGVKTFDFTTVQGETTKGQRLVDESKTLIVPLMRGGDPIARGVFRAFPAAMYHHAKQPEQIGPKHVVGNNTIILADWVINTGQGMIEFVKHIRENINGQVRIVMVAGVVQEQVVGRNGEEGVFAKDLAGMGDVTLVTLRVSENKYKGAGGTDTGDRLFNSTHLD
jgi:uracil phosphoribosyltransferase